MYNYIIVQSQKPPVLLFPVPLFCCFFFRAALETNHSPGAVPRLASKFKNGIHTNTRSTGSKMHPLDICGAVFGSRHSMHSSCYFTEDLMKCIQKIIDTPHTSERISFCNRIPPDDQDRSLPPQIHICNAYFFPDILFWDPLSRIPSLNGFLRCPREACSGKDSFLRAVGWKDGKTARNNPRRLYGLTCPVMLVSHIYRCQLHHHEILFHDSEVLQQLLEVDRQPFILSHITGMTRELQTTISSYICRVWHFRMSKTF